MRLRLQVSFGGGWPFSWSMVGYATIPTFSSGCVYTRMWRISFVVKIINAIIFIVIALDGVGFTATSTGLVQFLGRVVSFTFIA